MRLARDLAQIRALGMEPVLGNGVAMDVSNWMEACVARGLVTNALESNGFLKPRRSILQQPLRFESGAIVLEPQWTPQIDADCNRSASAGIHGMPSLGRTLVTGVIGSDTHIVGNRILAMALEEAGYKVVSLGALTPAEEFIAAAIETNADAILVSSLYGQGELDCRGFRELCVEAGSARYPHLRRRKSRRRQTAVGRSRTTFHCNGLRSRVSARDANRATSSRCSPKISRVREKVV